MSTTSSVPTADIQSLPLYHRGKVRDLYQLDQSHLLIVASDRVSAFDVVLPTLIPGKGAILTALSNFWFARMSAIVLNHKQNVSMTLEQALPDPREYASVADRAMVVRKLVPLPIEAIVRGYLAGSGWKTYQDQGAICHVALPRGLALGAKLPTPIYTPSTKAALGEHDEQIDFHHTAALLGEELAQAVRETSLRLYQEAADYALQRGIIIADTKFEFGLDENSTLVLMDEVLTPDSSRFWPTDQWHPGSNPPSFDKQYIRDYLETLPWNKRPPAPPLPPEIVTATVEKYRQVYQRLVLKQET